MGGNNITTTTTTTADDDFLLLLLIILILLFYYYIYSSLIGLLIVPQSGLLIVPQSVKHGRRVVRRLRQTWRSVKGYDSLFWDLVKTTL